MAICTTRRTRRISGRRLSWHPPMLTLTLSYTDGSEEATDYRVREIPSDAGRSFRLTRWTRPGEHGTVETHRVHVGGRGLGSCGCGAARWGGGCKHESSMRKLLDLRLIGGGIPAAGEAE